MLAAIGACRSRPRDRRILSGADGDDLCAARLDNRDSRVDGVRRRRICLPTPSAGTIGRFIAFVLQSR